MKKGHKLTILLSVFAIIIVAAVFINIDILPVLKHRGFFCPF